MRYKESNQLIGKNLRKIRMQKGLMQIDVAVATNLDRSYISRIETGKARITFNLLCRLVKGLEISSTDLIEDEMISAAHCINQGGGFYVVD